ncbi:MAG: hypothetical protein CMG74_12690 [Candidatus Marinimicrobia bacterium]|nr:hypothetical protein [Candidatus Neomarinimicrobiota bacterium]|tara:strand:- start:1981 stop:3519 length:1539 start_codon:yes stop_codon:yes gene_type:complete
MKNKSKQPNAKDGLWTFSTTILAALLAFPVSIISASLLGAGGMGSLKLIEVIGNYSARSDFGLTKSYAREIQLIAYKNDTQHPIYLSHLALSTSVLITVFVTLIVFIAYLSDVTFNGSVTNIFTLGLLLTYLLIDRLNLFFGKSLPAHGLFIVQSKSRMYRSILYPIIAIPLIFYWNLNGAIMAIIAARAFDVTYVWLKVSFKPKWVWNFHEVIRLQKVGIRLWSMNILNVINNSVELILLSSFLGLKVTGIYGFALGAIKLFRSFPESQSALFFRRYAIETGKDERSNAHYEKAMLIDLPIFMFFTMVFCIFGYYVYSLLILLFLNEFYESIFIMEILVSGAVVFSAKMISSHILNLMKKFKILLLIPIIMTVFQLILSTYLILEFGLKGAAIGFSITLFFSGLMYSISATNLVFINANGVERYSLVLKQISVSIISLLIFFYINTFNYNFSPLSSIDLGAFFEIMRQLLTNFIVCVSGIFIAFVIIYGRSFLENASELFKSMLNALGIKK